MKPEYSFLNHKEQMLYADEQIVRITRRYIQKIREEYSPEAIKKIDRYYQNKKLRAKIRMGYVHPGKMPVPDRFTAEAEKLLEELERYGRDLTDCYMRQLSFLWHISEKTGLTRLAASRNCRDAFHNEIVDAVFASSDYEGNLLFAARAVVGHVFVMQDHRCIFPESPFLGRGELKIPVAEYCLAAEGFEPTFDFRCREEGCEIVFSREWILRKDGIEGAENLLYRLPDDFYRIYESFYCADSTQWEQICSQLYMISEKEAEVVMKQLLQEGKLLRLG